MTRTKFFCLIVTGLLASSGWGQSFIPDPPTLKAKSFVLMDAESKTVLAEGNAHLKLPPASLTKIMTDYVAAAEIEAERLQLDELVEVSINAWKTGGSKMFIKEGTKVSVEDLLRGIIIQSGNDASVALAEHIAGDEVEFAKIMNSYAKELGLENTHYENATGLPHPEHVSTAYDNALLTQALISRFPSQYKMYAELEFTYNEITQPNRNRLLTIDPTVDGVKTGFTDDAGYCLVASAERNGLRLITAVMGTSSDQERINDTRKLLNYGFRYFERRLVAGKQNRFDRLYVKKGAGKGLQVHIKEDLYRLVPAGGDGTKYQIYLPEPLDAPIKKDAVVGSLIVSIDDKEVARSDVYAMYEVKKINFFTEMWNGVKSWFSTVPKEEEVEGPQTITVSTTIESQEN
ncbi:MAG: D-alanyl-D-alanine carboxypeptidase [Gammaproteobacteria bacterium]|nr:D-alanyl-D-alanine carboxypeptidase [Gammaproteobacteria bacterium]MYF02975.1 D-alanyl-D-alanine carboxypeptidase [Gammaproteobacteria bacterium]MYI76718.1 D-alanyl-D-alanine carboxypeptidase [Gammaproteobacteria bacterium]